jgi:type IV secretory pathway protease TraF
MQIPRMRRSYVWHRVLSILVLVALLVPGTAVALSPSAPLTNYPTETQAHQHCPADTVVWLNLPTGIYHFKDQRWYGRTNSGAYVCRGEADGAGMRTTRNGQ